MPNRSKETVVQEFRMQSLQEATMRVIARKGIAAATMQEIADEAGVAKGTIYLYFKDRDDLVEKTFEDTLNSLHARVDEAVAPGQSLEQNLRASLKVLFDFFEQHGEFFRLYTSQRLPEGNPQQQRRQRPKCEVYRQRIDRFAVLLSEAMERGEIRRMDAQRLALFITEGTNALVIERVMEQSSPAAEQDIDLIVGTLLDGVRTNRS